MPRPPSSKNEYGFSVGGPIKLDQAHFFFAYDGKSIDDSRQIVLRNSNGLLVRLGDVARIEVGPLDVRRTTRFNGVEGVGIGISNALWGGCNWGRGDVNINVNRYNFVIIRFSWENLIIIEE